MFYPPSVSEQAEAVQRELVAAFGVPVPDYALAMVRTLQLLNEMIDRELCAIFDELETVHKLDAP